MDPKRVKKIEALCQAHGAQDLECINYAIKTRVSCVMQSFESIDQLQKALMKANFVLADWTDFLQPIDPATGISPDAVEGKPVALEFIALDNAPTARRDVFLQDRAKYGYRIQVNDRVIYFGLGNRAGMHSYTDDVLNDMWKSNKEKFIKKLALLKPNDHVKILYFVNITRDRGRWITSQEGKANRLVDKNYYKDAINNGDY